jgi:hypothetical protein
MITKAWIDFDEEGMQQQVAVHISVTEPPTDANPYGAFRLDYCGHMVGMGDCMMQGYLEAADGGIRFYEVESDGEQQSSKALNLTVTESGGTGRLQSTGEGEGGDDAFAFAYDAELFHRAAGSDEQCFTRDARDPDTGFSVWRYGLYDAHTGDRINRNSGFPIEFSAGGVTYQGYLGYYGLSLPPEAAALLESGDTVTKVDYADGENPTRTDYAVVKSEGKLMRYTKRTTTLDHLDQIRFNAFVGEEAVDFFPGAMANMQYELYWNAGSGDFVVSGLMQCGDQGCVTAALEGGDQHVPASFWLPRGGVQGWSQSLGGEVFVDLHESGDVVDPALVQVVYRTQDLVYPADLPATLYCVQNCPTDLSLESYFGSEVNDPALSPFVASTFNNWNPTAAEGVVQYATDTATGLLVDGDDRAVTFADAEAASRHPQYAHGVMSGRLFETLDDAACDAPEGGTAYCDWMVSNADVYYQWQTGADSWNQFAAVKDGAGDFVTFDAPLQLSYHVPDEDHYGAYRGTEIVLQYGGFGDLWGIPGICVDRLTNAPVSCDTPDSRYVPSFVIPYDDVDGVVTSTGEDHTAYLVKWLEREIRFARKDLSECAALDLPLDVTLPTEAELQSPIDASSDVYIGDQPVVTDVPRVIHGEVKY